MTETEFTQLADAVFDHIEQLADAALLDCARSGAVLEIERDDGAKIIVNRHTPMQEIWLAAKSGGFHYAWQTGQGGWHSQRDGSELFAKLAELAGWQHAPVG